MIYYRIERL